MSDLNETQQRVLMVLDRIKNLVTNDENDAEVLAEVLDEFLTDLHSNDFFGTEGQLDPRGDFRDGDWSMEYVQGVDE